MTYLKINNGGIGRDQIRVWDTYATWEKENTTLYLFGVTHDMPLAESHYVKNIPKNWIAVY